MSAAIDPDHWVASRHALITQQRKAEVANHVTEAAFQKLAGSRSWLLKEQVSPLLQSVTGAKATIGDAEVNLVVDYVIENRPIDDYARQDVADSAAEMRLASKQLIDATEKFRYFFENKALATKAYTKFAGPGGALTRKQFADAMAFIAQDCKKTDSQGRLKDFVVSGGLRYRRRRGIRWLFSTLPPLRPPQR